MYINIKKRILSSTILQVAVVKIIAACLEGAIRIILKKSNITSPDMMDIVLWRAQITISFIQIIVIAFMFFKVWQKLNHYMKLVPKEDQQGIGELQKEVFGKSKLAALSVNSVNRLIQLWAVIFIGAELIYDFTSIMYRRFIGILMDALSSGTGMSDGTFVMLYNMTHGFKYLEILSAILLGVMMTGIFLSDRYLKIAAAVILGLFLISFGVLQMQTVYLMGREVGIVWTSMIYHITETVGLVVLSRYLTKQYKGL
ncbi:hypothetical protein D6855_04875 [Butyrivibrio sp. CB08]|uniref:hypothetical protein n=1 Tax=Butyrivibrio sp. CB08 TaxID=2364879 RepID=UPI000EA9EEC2|nr:hypothetical protein [Butyrivibrio sp. CB08]RKM61229.1 hypothetical protein D6855_04875 [Butyrivibrio sp. CB08]